MQNECTLIFVVSLGDLQCSVLPILNTDEDAALNISTSAQLCFKMSKVTLFFLLRS